jgi:hypothetical protein
MVDAAKLSHLITCLAALLMFGADAAAGEVDDLYQAQTIVTGQGEASRRVGFADCLEQVLVKVSGDPRLLGDPRLASMAEEAGTFVADFQYRDRMAGIPVHDEQGTRDRPYDLTVAFHPARIDAPLRTLGSEPWSPPRPRLVVLVAVRLGPTAYLLASDGEHGRDQREALADAAKRLGIPMVLPDQAALTKAGLSYESLPAIDLPRLDLAARTMDGDLALAGSMVWSEEALGWNANWRLEAQGESYGWQIRGVGFDDAFRNAMAGAAQILSGHGPPT